MQKNMVHDSKTYVNKTDSTSGRIKRDNEKHNYIPTKNTSLSAMKRKLSENYSQNGQSLRL